MHLMHNIPGCCSVGHMVGLNYGEIPPITCTSGHFLAVFAEHQKTAFDRFCQKHTCKAAIPTKSGHHDGTRIVICIFKKGKQ